MSYEICPLDSFYDLGESDIQRMASSGKTSFLVKEGSVYVGISDDNKFYRLAEGGGYGYTSLRKLMKKSPAFRSMLYNLYSTLGISPNIEVSEIIDETLPDAEGTKGVYWLLKEVMHPYEKLLTQPDVRNAIQNAVQKLVDSDMTESNIESVYQSLVDNKVPGNIAKQIAMKFQAENTGLSKSDAIRIWNNMSETFVPKYSQEEINAKLEKAQQKMTILEGILNRFVDEAGQTPKTRWDAVYAKYLNELMSTGLFNSSQAKKYLDKVMPQKGQAQPISSIVGRLGQPFVGSMHEPATPFIPPYYKALHEFVQMHPEHGPDIAKEIAKQLFEGPGELGTPSHLTSPAYSNEFIKQLGPQAIKKLMSSNYAQCIKTASEPETLQQILAYDQFQDTYGITVNDAVLLSKDFIIDNAIREASSFCAAHILTGSDGTRTAGKMTDNMRESIKNSFEDYFVGLKEAYDKDIALQHNNKAPLYVKTYLRRNAHVGFWVERMGFRTSQLSSYFDPQQEAMLYANKATTKLTNMGRMGLALLAVLALGGITGGALSGTPVDTGVDIVNPFMDLSDAAPSDNNVDMEWSDNYVMSSNAHTGKEVTAQMDILGTLEATYKQKLMQLFSDPHMRSQPAVLQSAINQLAQDATAQVMPIYNQIRQQSALPLDQNLVEEMASQRAYAHSKRAV